MEAYGDGYMAPEEEWEREGLLDPAWEKQQKKVSECILSPFEFSFAFIFLDISCPPLFFFYFFFTFLRHLVARGHFWARQACGRSISRLGQEINNEK